MTASVVGALRVTLGIDSAQFDDGLKSAQKNLKAAGDRLTSVGKSLSLGLTAPLAGFATLAVSEAKETAAAMGQVEAALASMGPVAGRTSEQLKKAADAFEGSSLFEGDEILSKVTANMLTFGNISGEVFDRAQQAVIDLSARMGTDLQSATVMIGKALNDPIQGLSALRRVGIQFTDAQEKQIAAMVKVGNTAGAQKIMLAELERQYGGAAAAAQNTDPWNQMSDAFKSIAESVGTILLPLIPPLAEAFKSVAAAFTSLSPETQKWVVILGAVVAAIGPVLVILGSIVSAVGTVLPVIAAVAAAFSTFAAVVTGAVLPAIGSALVALAPILIPLAAVAAAITAVYLVWKNWDKIEPILRNLYNQVKMWIVDKLGPIWKRVTDHIDLVRRSFAYLYDKVVGNSYIPDMVDQIGVHMARLQKVMVKPSKEAVEDARRIFEEGAREIAATIERMTSAGPLVKERIAPEMVDTDEIARQAGEYGKVIFDKLEKPTEKTTSKIAQTFADMTRNVADSLSGLSRAIKSGNFLDIIAEVANTIGTILEAVRSIKGISGGGSSGSSGGGGGFEGFARGGSFKVGGMSGIDKNLVAFKASRGEMVNISRPGQDIGGGRPQVFDMRGAIVTQELLSDINRRIAAGEARATVGGANLALSRVGRARGRALA